MTNLEINVIHFPPHPTKPINYAMKLRGSSGTSRENILYSYAAHQSQQNLV